MGRPPWGGGVTSGGGLGDGLGGGGLGDGLGGGGLRDGLGGGGLRDGLGGDGLRDGLAGDGLRDGLGGDVFGDGSRRSSRAGGVKTSNSPTRMINFTILQKRWRPWAQGGGRGHRVGGSTSQHWHDPMTHA